MEKGSKIKEDDFSFFKYVKYQIFDWTKTLCCIELDWEDCRLVDNTREEANCQMDVTRLFRRLQMIENILLHIVDKEEKDMLGLVKPESLGSIKRNRMIMEYYDLMVQGKFGITIEQDIEETRMEKIGTWLIRQYDSGATSRSNKIAN